MRKKRNLFAMAMAASILFSSIGNATLSYALDNDNQVITSAEKNNISHEHEYDDLYKLKVEITHSPTTPYDPYTSDSAPDYSDLRVSVFSVDTNDNLNCIIEDATLNVVEDYFNVEVIPAAGGGGVFAVFVSAYSSTLSQTVTADAEFRMMLIDDFKLIGLRSEIVTLPDAKAQYNEHGLDLSGLTISVWETYKNETVKQTLNSADLKELEEKYDVNISYEFPENDNEGICVITISSYPNAMVVQSKCEFPFIINNNVPITKGDVNDDGEFNVADVVALQKWLLAVPDVELKNWKAADLCENDGLDVFDLCLMKRELIKTMNNTYPVENPEVIDEFTPCTATIDDVFDDWSICVVIKCQYSVADKKWTKENFNGIENIRKISQRETFNPYRQVLDISLEEKSKDNVLKLVHDIESLGLPDIKEVMVVSHGFGSN